MAPRDSRTRIDASFHLCLAALLALGACSAAHAQVIEPLPPPPSSAPGNAFGSFIEQDAEEAGPQFGGSHFGSASQSGGYVNEGPTSPYPPMAPPALATPLFAPRPDPWASPSAGLPWVWQLMPDGLIYRSYLAGVKEPRLALLITNQSGFGSIWDSTLGARVALLRYGTQTAYRPEGFEVDLEGAAEPRIQPLLESSPLVSCDYRIGIPVTYGIGPWQFKTGYYHVSAHLGDEYIHMHPSVQRINYVRDAIMFGVSYYYTEALRLFAEFDYAAGVSGGAEPGEFQFGIDYSPAVRHGAPFFALYGNLRQEVDYGGYFVVQTGWQWRGGAAMHTLRLGVQYFNGQSPQYEFFNTFEQNAGFGIWYDF
ncbi:MAG: DUF1207 domain-containing protein [Pirellulales bacterium]